jgi:hypothetical protein
MEGWMDGWMDGREGVVIHIIFDENHHHITHRTGISEKKESSRKEYEDKSSRTFE